MQAQAQVNKTKHYVGDVYVKLGDFNLNHKHPAKARDEYLKAVTVYQKVYGINTNLLINPYEGLAQAYRELGDQVKADFYSQKAATLACPL